ncbi:MAG: hypothetical protein JNL58_05635 [Planctomyces sp.]|nr:hypothetical protein [Planctomyces sp.]
MITSEPPQSLRSVQALKWLALRLVAPLILTALIIRVTLGDHYFNIFGPLVWTLFTTHILATFVFTRTHLLDTGSFFWLIFASGAAANIGERGHVYNLSSWLGFGVFFAMYLMLSLIGRCRADRLQQVARSVSIYQVVAALCLLFVAVIVCSASKTAVGLLFVPGFLIIPFILFWSLVNRGKRIEQPVDDGVNRSGESGGI